MKRTGWTQMMAALTLLGSALPAAHVSAHISTKGALQSRGGDEKMSPCDGARGDGMVYTFEPGAMVTIAVNEDIPHPSYFRIAFDNDGQDFVEPASIEPIDKSRACPFDKDDQCGKSDYCSTAGASKGAIVLWDNLDPHLSSAAKGGSWTVKLPDVECDNCTLQVLQVMEDTVHGAYCPQGTCANSSGSLEDIYHRCIDIKLAKGAPAGPGVAMAATKNNGMECAASAATGAAGTSGAAGAGASAGSSAAAGAVATSGSGGAPASSTAGTSAAGGSSASSTITAAGSGGAGTAAPASSTTGSTARPASAGTTAPTAAPKSTAGASGSVGTSTSATTASAAGTTASGAGSAPSDSGGCSVSGTRSNMASAWTWLLGFGWLLRRRRGSRP